MEVVVKRIICLLPIFVLSASGCVGVAFIDHQGLEAIEPAQSDAALRIWAGPDTPVNVDSLQPTFRWQKSPSSGATYDFIVYQAVKRDPAPCWMCFHQSVEPGKVVYSREGLASSEHKIETPLQAGTDYLWTFRAHEGDKISEWSSYSLEKHVANVGGNYWYKRSNMFYRFHTP